MISLQQIIQDEPNLSQAELVAQFKAMPFEERKLLALEVFQTKARLRQEEQLLFYQPVSKEARKIHLSTAKEVITVGGNRSSKTDSHLAEMAIQMTGHVPYSLQDIYPREKLRCPIQVRLTCESLTNTWEPVLKPKLQWNKWNGRGEPGGPFGHWGWIPRKFLIKGKWEESWSEKNRTLTLMNGSTMQLMSYDQDVGDFQGGSFHLILHDEGPPSAIYRENKMRTIDTAGRLMTAMTPPDDESASWDAAWVHDDLYEKGLPGPEKDPDIDTFTLFTLDNRILDKNEVEKITRGLTPMQAAVRLKGAFMHLGGRIYPTYTNRTEWWCFKCNRISIVEKSVCVTCGGSDTVTFNHLVEPFEAAYGWPSVFLLDPHPRKANMMLWVAIDPTDDWWVVAELESDKSPVDSKVQLFEDVENHFRLNVAHRIIDPNMGRSRAHNAGPRETLVVDEWSAVGIRCDDRVGDSFAVAKERLRERLKPDPRTRKPRLHVFNTCHKANQQMLKWTFDEFARHSSDRRDPKQVPRQLHSDMPTLLGYLANFSPSYYNLQQGGRKIARVGMRGGY